jgi:hypothetical protein
LPGAAPDRSLLWLAPVLAAFLALAYGPALHFPFLGDDYVFLDRVLRERFLDLASRANTDFGWYRPWSRDLHYWLLAHAVGLEPARFRLASFALWLAAHLLLFTFLSRFAPRPVPALAALGSAALSLWGAPLLWMSGAQDLWMLVWGLATLNLHARRASIPAAVALVPALLSKETAVVFPLIAVGYSWLVAGAAPREALRRNLPMFFVTGAWIALHPTLIAHVIRPGSFQAGQPSVLGPMEVATRTILSSVSIEQWPHPTDYRVGDVWLELASAAVLALGAWLATRPAGGTSRVETSRGRVAAFGVLWILVGWSPVAVPGLYWHAYYACVGAMGSWLLIALALARWTRFAVPVLATMALVRAATAHTPSWDWGNQWFQSRASVILAGIQSELIFQHPTLAPHTRVFFGRIPNNVGLVAGRSAALRVWYHDSTLDAGFYSSYRPRAAGEAPGEDLFFRFDTLLTLVEVRTGPEDVAMGMRDDPEWVDDHERLALLFARNGDLPRAAAEFEKVGRATATLNDLICAAACRARAGDSLGAKALFDEAARRSGRSRAEFLLAGERWFATAVGESARFAPPRARTAPQLGTRRVPYSAR